MWRAFVNRSRAAILPAILTAILMFTAGVTIGQNAQEPPCGAASGHWRQLREISAAEFHG